MKSPEPGILLWLKSAIVVRGCAEGARPHPRRITEATPPLCGILTPHRMSACEG
jgi:hypothetical protein